MRTITPAAPIPIVIACVLAALSPVARAGAPAPQPGPEPLVVRVDDGGFRWGDAGVGAAAGFGAALVLAGSLALAGRRDRGANPTRHQEEEQ